MTKALLKQRSMIGSNKRKHFYKKQPRFQERLKKESRAQYKDYEDVLKRPVFCAKQRHEKEELKNFCKNCEIGHYRNVRGLGKSMVVFRLLEKLRYSNERSTIF